LLLPRGERRAAAIIGAAGTLNIQQGDHFMRSINTWFIVVLTLLLAAAEAAGQTTRPTPPPPSVGTQAPPAQRGLKIDPKQDVILRTIRQDVSPTEEQMKRIIELYTELREKHLQLARATVRELRELRLARQAGQRLGEDEKTDEQIDAERNREDADRARFAIQIEKKMKPINKKFLADCRALLDESQYEAWDECVKGLDLTRGGTKSTREELQWLDPDRGPEVGEEAPNFELRDLEGGTVSLQSLRGKPVVIQFASFTDPNFRKKAPRFEWLKQSYGDRVHWLLIYTFEVHASDGKWVSYRNKSEGIEIPQHKTIEDRLDCARMTREKLRLSQRVLVDDLEDTVADLYSGHPNRAYVIDETGAIVSKQVWANSDRTREALEKLFAEPSGEDATADSEEQDRQPPDDD
jgi:Spy/CpxP family protein refolding chaperone